MRLPVHELVDVLRRVMPQHSEDRNGMRTVLILATATTFEQAPDEIDVTLVAWPDRTYYNDGTGPEQGLWEGGRCVRCGVEVTSNAKQVYCPVCNIPCALT